MTRDEIYDHLAQVYLGKKNKIEQEQQEQDRKEHFHAWLVINVVITVIIFASSFYGLTAFLAQRGDTLQNRIIYSLNKGPIRVKYNVAYPYPPVEPFSLTVPQVDAEKYKNLHFSIRGTEEGTPGIMRVELKNRRNEVSSVFIEDVRLDWKSVDVPLEEFQQISDWTNIETVSFILESWNAEKKKGIVLIDDVCFSS